jgi:hypothetical protein
MAHRSLVKMAEQTNTSMQEMLDRAVENERRRLLLERTNAAYSKLRQNKKAWKNWQAELRELDATLSDGI